MPASCTSQVNGALLPVRVHTGLDDGTLIEVSGAGLKAGDEVVINAVRTDAAHGGTGTETPRQSGNSGAFRQGGSGVPRL